MVKQMSISNSRTVEEQKKQNKTKERKKEKQPRTIPFLSCPVFFYSVFINILKITVAHEKLCIFKITHNQIRSVKINLVNLDRSNGSNYQPD